MALIQMTQEQVDAALASGRLPAGSVNVSGGATVSSDQQSSNIKNLQSQILSQGTTGKWTGEGFGGPERNAYEIASLLHGAGITDLKDFGKITKTNYVRTPVQQEARWDEDGHRHATGKYFTQDPDSGVVSYVDPSTVKNEQVTHGAGYGEDPFYTVTNYFVNSPVEETLWGNKKTGQAISNNYNRAGGNIFSGTYAGKDSTGFGVQFGPDGTPYFYTQKGASTSSMGNIVPVLSLGLAIFAPGIGTAIGAALGATGTAAAVLGGAIVSGTMAELSGGDFIDGAIKGAVSAGIAPAVAGSVGNAVAEAMTDSALKNVVSSAISSSVSSAIVAGATGQDVGAAAFAGAVMGATGSAGQDIGTAAQYGTDPFSEQTQALAVQDRGMGFSGASVGQNIGSAIGSIALGAPEDQALLGALTKTISQGLSSLPSFSGTAKEETKVADSGEEGTQVAEAIDSDSLKSMILNSASQVASSGDPSIDLAEIERLRTEGLFPVDTPTDTSNIEIAQDSSEPSALDVLGEPMTQEAIDVTPVSNDQFDTSALDVLGQPITPEAVDVTPAGDDITNTPFQGPMGPMTEDKVKRYNEEFAKYLDFIQAGEPPPPEYEAPPFNEPGEYWDEFNDNLKTMMDEGRLPSQWQPDEEGNYTYVDDDGSTLTIGPSGDIVHYTDAPEGNLPGEEPDTVASESSTESPKTNLVTTTTAAGPRPTTFKPRVASAIAGLAGAGLSPSADTIASTAVKPLISPLSITGDKTDETWTGGRGKTGEFINPMSSGEVRVDPIPDVVKRQESNLPGGADTAQEMLKSKYSSGSEDEDSEDGGDEGNMMDYYSYGKPSEPGEVLRSFSQFAKGGRALASPLQAAAGGVPHKGSHYVQGDGGGQDDLIDARLADGEYVFDADIVAALGDGSNKRGAEILDKFRMQIRKHKRSAPRDKIPPAAKSPLAYLKEVT